MSRSPFDRILDRTALTFDDVLLVPAASSILPAQAQLQTQFTRNIALNIPLISAAMDSVTDVPMAIALAQLGGIGVLHRNMPVSEQANKVSKIKKFQARIVHDVMAVSPDTSITEVMEMQQRYGVSVVPVLDPAKTLLGFVTYDHLTAATDPSEAVGTIMQKDNLPITDTAQESSAHRQKMSELQFPFLFLLDAQKRCVGIVTQDDHDKLDKHPNACVDSHGRLRVAAAVGTGSDHFDRVETLMDSGVDAIVVDTAHGHSKAVTEMVTFIRRQRSAHIDVIAGNIATSDAAHTLIDAGADAVKVGIGPGSICTTRIVAGVGMPQITAVMNAAEACSMHNIPVIADGGIRFSGDLAKALAAGASSVMLGSLFAGTDESPGDLIDNNGKKVKLYRGMGSLGAMNQGSADRYGQGEQKSQGKKLVPEGVEGQVPYKGALADVVDQLLGGIRAALGYTGCATIAEMHKSAQFTRITNAGLRESHVHSLHGFADNPNYKRD